MAFLENRNGKFRIKFRYDGRQYSRSLKTKSEQKANLAKGQIERNLELVSLGLLQVPEGCNIFDFFLTGQDTPKPTKEQRAKDSKRQGSANLSIERLFNMYFDAFLKESIEENSYGMLQTHRNNLQRVIGKRTRVADFGTGEIQKYVDKRSKEKGRRGTVQATTIRKEVTTLTTYQVFTFQFFQSELQHCGRRNHHLWTRRHSWRFQGICRSSQDGSCIQLSSECYSETY